MQNNRLVLIIVTVIIAQSICFNKVTSAAKHKHRRPKTPSGLYHDNGKGHTMLMQKFSKKDVREISNDILNIMGLNHRPHPHLIDHRSPASQFLKEVYNSIATSTNEGDVDLSNGANGRKQNWHGSLQPKNLSWSEFNVDRSEVDAIKQADAIISFINRGHRFSDKLKNVDEENQFWFDVSEVSEFDLVLAAELRIWKRTLRNKNMQNDLNIDSLSDMFRITIHQVSPSKDDSLFELSKVDEIVTPTIEQGWLRFNVTSAFREWVQEPTNNFGLVISIKAADSEIEISKSKSGLASVMDAEEHQPFLVSFLKTSDIGRAEKAQKRSARKVRSTNGNADGSPQDENEQVRNKKSKKKGRKLEFMDSMDRLLSCQMGMLYINFEDLGWKDWVIAPDGFIAYYCHGECSFPLTENMNATNHAIVATLVHTYYPTDFPKPHCSPTKLGSISMLYYDDNSNVTVKKYKDMVIKSCGCK